MPSAGTPEERLLAALGWNVHAGPPSPELIRAAAQVAPRLDRAGARVVLACDPDYPPGLRDLSDPPPALFVRGTLPVRSRAVAIVGARAATPYGRARAYELARDLVRAGCTIVSGLAQGIDAAAHQGALAEQGSSVAVLPGGLDAITPPAHEPLALALCAHGGLISERASGAPGFKGAFVKRNRLIAALSSVTVVVEAAERSGALSTAARARRIGRPVLAVPGDVDRPTSRGTHRLLREGAALCENAADVIAVLGPPEAPSDPAGRLIAALVATPRSAEVLAATAGLSVDDTLARLLSLEWSGIAAREPGPRWRRGGA